MKFSSFLLVSSCLSSAAWAFVPLKTTSQRLSLSSPSSSTSSSSSSSALFLADEIKQYRKGLSQIHKNPDDIHPNGDKTPQRIVDCVFKFGGSSLANAERIDHVAKLIKDQIQQGYRPRAVVCSAMGKTTNNLLSAGEFALGESELNT